MPSKGHHTWDWFGNPGEFGDFIQYPVSMLREGFSVMVVSVQATLCMGNSAYMKIPASGLGSHADYTDIFSDVQPCESLSSCLCRYSTIARSITYPMLRSCLEASAWSALLTVGRIMADIVSRRSTALDEFISIASC